MSTQPNDEKQPMENSNEELERLAFKQNEYMDARAAELLNHDPELVELYHRSKKWKLDAKALQAQLIKLIEPDQLALLLRNRIGSYKNLSSRMEDLLPDAVLKEGVASDCAEALEVAADNLKLLAAEIRRQISELTPGPTSDAAQWKKVEEAGLRAMIESFRKY